MAHVLIGFAEALPAPEVLFSLRAAGHRVSVFARTRGLPLERLAPGRVFVLPDPAAGTVEAIAALRAVMAQPDAPDIVLPLDDGGLWLTDAALGADPRSAGATGAQARIALDKTLQVEAAQAAGLRVPPTRIVRAPGDLDGYPDGDLEGALPGLEAFPAIAKPALAVRERDGRLGKGDAVYLRGAGDLDALRAGLDRAAEPLLVQPLIAGVGEGVFGHATQGGVIGWSGHRRVRMMNPHGSGSSACTALSPDPETRKRVAAFVAAIGWRGPFMVELLRDAEGTAWFMELNGRMWGSLALARRQGLEYPAWAIATALDPAFCPVPPEIDGAVRVQRNLGRDLVHLLFVLRGPKSEFHRAGWPGFWRSLAGVFRPAHPRAFYNYDPAHRGFFLREAVWTLRKALKR